MSSIERGREAADKCFPTGILLRTDTAANHRRSGPSKRPGQSQHVVGPDTADVGHTVRGPLAHLVAEFLKIRCHPPGKIEVREIFF